MSIKKVIVGISGGVDSAVAAARLKHKGLHVEGIYIQNGFPADDEYYAQLITDRLGIKLHKVDIAEVFKREVVGYFMSEYGAGRTPNPCIVCNKKIKFNYLLKEAREREFDFVATGHYARIGNTGRNSDLRLLKGLDANKDQSYFLFSLGQEELEKIIFPNGNDTKEDIKREAAELGFDPLNRRESQEICFIPGNNYKEFIERYSHLVLKSGDIVDRSGRKLGKHRGIHSYTIGQRKGLNISSECPSFVLEIDPARNEIIVGRREDQISQGLTVKDVSWVSPDFNVEKVLTVKTKIRYRHGGVESEVIPVSAVASAKSTKEKSFFPRQEGDVYVRFLTPQKAVAPGQAAVFYQGDVVVGGGWIEKGVRID